MRYQEFPPSPSLASHVRCAWTFEADASERGPAQHVVPDGRCELVFHLGDPFTEADGAARPERVQPTALFAGQLSRPLWLRATGRAAVLGVRFHPAGARGFLGFSVAEATDRRVPLASLWPRETDECLHALAACAPDARLAAIEALCDATGVSRRQLERRFRDAVGLPPRLFANVLRLRSVFDALQADPRAGWTDAALAAGYFDQSHLIRDFRRFVGCTPAQFLARDHGIGVAIVQSPVAAIS